MSRSSKWSLSFWFLRQNPVSTPLRPHAWYIPCLYHPPRLDNSNCIWWRVQVIREPHVEQQLSLHFLVINSGYSYIISGLSGDWYGSKWNYIDVSYCRLVTNCVQILLWAVLAKKHEDTCTDGHRPAHCALIYVLCANKTHTATTESPLHEYNKMLWSIEPLRGNDSVNIFQREPTHATIRRLLPGKWSVNMPRIIRANRTRCLPWGPPRDHITASSKRPVTCYKKLREFSWRSSISGLDTKTDRLTDRQPQCDSDSDSVEEEFIWVSCQELGRVLEMAV
jgi:hypothetical protein